MKFTQIIAALFMAATAQAAVAAPPAAPAALAGPADTDAALRSCADRCLDESNSCARRHHRERECEDAFHSCEERCRHDHEHDHDYDHDHDHHGHN